MFWEILEKLGSKKPFNKKGSLTKSGRKAYGELISIIDNLYYMDVITEEEYHRIRAYLDDLAD